VQGLLNLMVEVVEHREQVVERIPTIVLEDNAKKLADDIEAVCVQSFASS
jgi:hypothetical protein